MYCRRRNQTNNSQPNTAEHPANTESTDWCCSHVQFTDQTMQLISQTVSVSWISYSDTRTMTNHPPISTTTENWHASRLERYVQIKGVSDIPVLWFRKRCLYLSVACHWCLYITLYADYDWCVTLSRAVRNGSGSFRLITVIQWGTTWKLIIILKEKWMRFSPEMVNKDNKKIWR